MKYYICPKCNTISTMSEHKITVRAGDNGYATQKAMRMDCCGFFPLFEPKLVEK